MDNGEIFDSIIVDENISMSDMPPVHKTSLMANIKYYISEYKQKTKENLMKIALTEIGDATIINCNMPPEKELFSANNI